MNARFGQTNTGGVEANVIKTIYFRPLNQLLSQDALRQQIPHLTFNVYGDRTNTDITLPS